MPNIVENVKYLLQRCFQRFSSVYLNVCSLNCSLFIILTCRDRAIWILWPIPIISWPIIGISEDITNQYCCQQYWSFFNYRSLYNTIMSSHTYLCYLFTTWKRGRRFIKSEKTLPHHAPFYHLPS